MACCRNKKQLRTAILFALIILVSTAITVFAFPTISDDLLTIGGLGAGLLGSLWVVIANRSNAERPSNVSNPAMIG